VTPAPLTREQQRLVEGCMRLVPHLVKSYRSHSLSREDLIAHGYMGLVDAARKFDPARKLSFTTYAGWWVRAHILRAIVSESGINKTGPWNRAFWKFWTSVSTEELAAKYDLDVGELGRVRAIIVHGHVRLDQSSRAVNDNGDKRTETLAAAIGDSNAPSPDAALEASQLSERVKVAIASLPVREQRIIRERYCDKPKTLSEIGEKIGRSRERVRTLEQKALLKLRRILEERAA
jgi:RNA polymerase primary sigma factor